MQPLSISDFEISNISFSEPKRSDRYNVSYLSYADQTGFVLQTPKLTIKSITDNFIDFWILRKSDKQRLLYSIIRSLELLAIHTITENSVPWFTRQLGEDLITNMFKSSVQCPEDIDGPFIIRIPRNKFLSLEGQTPRAVALLKVDGLIFGKNVTSLKMEVVQIKFLENIGPVTFQEEEPAHFKENFYNDVNTVIDQNLESPEFPEIGGFDGGLGVAGDSGDVSEEAVLPPIPPPPADPEILTVQLPTDLPIIPGLPDPSPSLDLLPPMPPLPTEPVPVQPDSIVRLEDNTPQVERKKNGKHRSIIDEDEENDMKEMRSTIRVQIKEHMKNKEYKEVKELQEVLRGMTIF